MARCLPSGDVEDELASPGIAMRQTFEATKIFHLSLDEPLPSLEVESRYREVLLILMTGGQIVGDNCRDDDRPRDLCRRLPVRYVRENAPGTARARNRGVVEATGELIAFTDDDCIVDSRWLNGLGTTFADPLVMAATGYIGPLELETRAQYLFEAHGGFEKRFRDMVL